MGQTVYFDIIDDCIDAYHKYQDKLPYHLNVIQELHSNENAHSRILTKLLQYTSSGRYIILESLLDYIISHNPRKGFSNIEIETPVITQEEQRIDVWIRDKSYTIILENKIYEAGDQEKQLERYITKSIKAGYEMQNIYVLYMPPYTREPSEQTWGKYKEKFQNRYAIVSFNEDILEWLKEYVLPNVTLKEVYLRSAIEQYLDYLEVYSHSREEQQEEQVLSIILSKLGVDHNSSDDKIYYELMKFHRNLADVRSSCSKKMSIISQTVRKHFDDITQGYWGIGFIFSPSDQYYQIYKQEWKKKVVHFEWINLTDNSLFDSKEQTLVLHVEGDRSLRDKMIDALNEQNKDEIKNGTILNYPICMQNTYYIPHGRNSFAELTFDEKKQFLIDAYSNVESLVGIIDRVISESEKK